MWQLGLNLRGDDHSGLGRTGLGHSHFSGHAAGCIRTMTSKLTARLLHPQYSSDRKGQEGRANKQTTYCCQIMISCWCYLCTLTYLIIRAPRGGATKDIHFQWTPGRLRHYSRLLKGSVFVNRHYWVYVCLTPEPMSFNDPIPPLQDNSSQPLRACPALAKASSRCPRRWHMGFFSPWVVHASSAAWTVSSSWECTSSNHSHLYFYHLLFQSCLALSK